MPTIQVVETDEPVREGGGATLATAVYERLRADVISGALLPGQKLRMETLRERYCVGASPVREALNRLAAECLVSQIDQKGFRVSPVSIDELQELTRARLWVTEMALREAIAHGDAAWEERIVLAFHRMTRTVRHAPNHTQFVDASSEKFHREFHSALLAACGSRWITNFAEMLFDCARRYQFLSLTSPSRPRDIVGEHRAIMDAALARDVELAVKLHNAHIELTADIISGLNKFIELKTTAGASQ